MSNSNHLRQISHYLTLILLLDRLLCQDELKNKTFINGQNFRKIKPYLGNCTSKWKKDNSDLPEDEDLKQTTMGFYYCEDTQHLVYLGMIDSAITFSHHESNKTSKTGDDAKFYCETNVVAPEMFSNFTIVYRGPDGAILNTYSMLEQKTKLHLKLNHTHKLTGYGEQTFHCIVYHNVDNQKGWRMDNNDSMSLNIVVYASPTNVKPSETSIMLGNIVVCTAEGYPLPEEISWSCQGSGWKSEKENLTLQSAGEHHCTCTAKAIMFEEPVEGFWNGTIHVKGDGAKLILTSMLASVVAYAHLILA